MNLTVNDLKEAYEKVMGTKNLEEDLLNKARKDVDDFLFAAFEYSGYSKEWLLENRERISKVEGKPMGTYIYFIDGFPIFTIEDVSEFGEYGKYVVTYHVK